MTDKNDDRLLQEPILQFFEYKDIPSQVRATVEPFRNMAYEIVASLPRNPERTICLRKLLEAKDAAVRALIYKTE